MVRQQKMRRRRRHHPIPTRQLEESMRTYIIAKIKQEEQAAPSQDNASGSIISKEVRVSDNIRALRRAIMNVERAMELDDQMERYAMSLDTQPELTESFFVRRWELTMECNHVRSTSWRVQSFPTISFS